MLNLKVLGSIALDFLKKNYLVVFIGIFAFYMYNKSVEDKKQVISMYNAMQDSTIVKMDKLGRKYSETSQIRASDTKVFLTTNSNDPSIKALQEEVKSLKNKLEDGGSVTKFNTNINIQKPLQITYQDDGSISANATDNKWYDIKNTIRGSEGETDVKIYNKYTVSLIKEKGEYVAQIRNENPYAVTDSIKSFVKIPSNINKKYSVGVGVSYDPINKNVIPTVSIHRNIFSF